MSLLSEADRGRLKQALAGMVNPVRLLFFTQTLNCETCLSTRQILDELPPLNDKLTVEEHNALLERDRAAEHGISFVPAVVVAADTGARIAFFGAPSGYEFMSLVDAILMTSKGESGLSEESRALLKGVDKPLAIKVFVTPT